MDRHSKFRVVDVATVAVATFLLAAALVGCQSGRAKAGAPAAGATSAQPQRGGTLTYTTNYQPPTLDPAKFVGCNSASADCQDAYAIFWMRPVKPRRPL
jgi:ABC-type transport system substrate-binding protein